MCPPGILLCALRRSSLSLRPKNGAAMPENVPESVRPEIFRELAENAFEVVERETGLWEKLYGNTALRKAVLLVVLAGLWEVYARWLGKPLLFPTLSDTVAALLASV